MKITFHRQPLGRYHSIFERPDGAVLRLEGGSYNKLGGGMRVPHDIAHLLVEQAFELRRGLWGTLAAGGLVQTAAFVGGRKPPHAEKKAWAVTDAAGETLRQAEVVVRAVADALVEGGRVRTGERWAMPASPEAVARVGEQLREAAARWAAVPEGGTLELTWPLRP